MFLNPYGALNMEGESGEVRFVGHSWIRLFGTRWLALSQMGHPAGLKSLTRIYRIKAMDPRIDVLLEMLARYRGQLKEALEKVPADRREVRSGAAWSAANVIEHLATTERSVTSLISRFLAEAPPRPDTEVFDRAQFDRDIDVRQFLDRTVRIKGSQPSGLLSAGEAWHNLKASRTNLLGVVEGARGRRLEDFARSHPTGQDLNGYQWLAFVAVHEGRHAAQLEEIARSLQA